ncbi:MAG: phosphotransferase [Deltaproteobacteria bacterium]|nr:phosphotransferase [Deltaproteobacteria bacterium]MCB9785914.1 phosphotransferase [Deltaproteobacteria bacterium]
MSERPRDFDADAVTHWLRREGLTPESVEALPGGASLRRYWRVRTSGTSSVLMTMPYGGPASEELGKPGASAGADFVAMATWLDGLGLPVPRLQRVDLDGGAILLEDLGDRRLYDAITAGADLEATYLPALELLVAFQSATYAPAEACPNGDRRCDVRVLQAELEHFLEYGIDARQGRRLLGDRRAALEALFASVAARLGAAPTALAHRDFQSQNIMITPRGLVLIDFQDAFVAPATYDLVALLRDSYVVLEPAALARLIDTYHRLRLAERLPGDPLADRVTLGRLFDLQTIQRKLKDAGRFEYIAQVKQNPSFLRYFADSVAYAVRALERFPEYGDALDALCRAVPEAMAARRA